MQTTSSEIWTLIIVTISYDDNYNKSAFLYTYNKNCRREPKFSEKYKSLHFLTKVKVWIGCVLWLINPNG